MPADPERVTDDDLTAMVAEVAAQSGFAGVVRVDRGGRVIEFAAGAADRATGRAISTTSRLALASGTKSLTAVLIATLIDEGRLRFDSPVAPLVGRELPLIDPAVSVEHLLTHRSGIADYLGDDTGGLPTGYLPADLARTTDYLPLLAGLAAKSLPGEHFSYCSAGFVILALIAEQVTGQDFHTLVRHRVIGPAGLTDSDFLRSDALPADAALGYLEDGAPNTDALPVIGSGDGGSYSTVADIRGWWEALYAGRVVTLETLGRLTTPVSERPPGPAEPDMYACGFWVYRASRRVAMEGYDTGVSFRSVHDPATDTTYTVIGTTSAAAWPVAAALESVLRPADA